MTTSTITSLHAATLVDHYVLVNAGDAVLSGYLTSYDDTTVTVSHVDHRGVTTGTTVLPYADVTTLVDFYDDTNDTDD